MENSSEFYYEKLKTADNPGVILSSLYCSLYDIKVSRSEIIMFNRLVKTFSRFTIFFSVLDMKGSKPDRLENPYAYLYEICKRRFESSHQDSILQARQNLDKYIETIDDEIEQLEKEKKKLKIPSSEGLE